VERCFEDQKSEIGLDQSERLYEKPDSPYNAT